MMEEATLPETKVLAVASHVVYGYVGNKMASFCMQALGCDVSALNTVHFSNHLGYKDFKGTKSSPEEIRDIYEGLKKNHLIDFDVMLSGFVPGAEGVNAVGAIARDLKFRGTMKAGSFFWALDPVMGDNGRLYVNENVVPAYKSYLRDADLILPNQFEAELLSDTKITSPSSLYSALETLHTTYGLPHVVVTSVRLPGPSAPSPDSQDTAQAEPNAPTNPTSPQHLPQHSESPQSKQTKSTLSVVGSSRTSTGQPRAFIVTVPDLDFFFAGTGDMFAGLLVARLRAAVAATKPSCANNASWMSPDEVPATELPLASAIERVLNSMQEVLVKTKEECEEEMAAWEGSVRGRRYSQNEEDREGVSMAKAEDANSEAEKKHAEHEKWLKKTKAAEVKVVRHVELLKGKGTQADFKAVELKF